VCSEHMLTKLFSLTMTILWLKYFANISKAFNQQTCILCCALSSAQRVHKPREPGYGLRCRLIFVGAQNITCFKLPF